MQEKDMIRQTVSCWLDEQNITVPLRKVEDLVDRLC